jgi:CheY-like chemotaxis protein
MENTILLVDDVRMFLEIQKEYLQNSPVKIMTARNGLEALHAIESKRPDLIFMDLEMPQMDGVECCRAIKGRPEWAAIPVVVITARGDEASRISCRSAGCNDFLTKPLDRNMFLDTAARFVAGIDRRQKREPIDVPGVFRSRGVSFHCILCNLSIGGAFITTDFCGDVGRLVQLSFTLPDGSAIECQGKITWFKLSSAGSPLGFGINFVLLPKSTKDAINNFLQEEG